MSQTLKFYEWQVFLGDKAKDSGHIRAPINATPGSLWVMLQEGKWVSQFAVDDQIYMMWETPEVLRFEYVHGGNSHDIRLVLFDQLEMPVEKLIQKTNKVEKYDRFSLSKKFIQEKLDDDENRNNRITRRRKDDAFKKPVRKSKTRSKQ